MNKNIKTLVGAALTTSIMFIGSLIGVSAATLEPGTTIKIGPQAPSYSDFSTQNVVPTSTGNAVAQQQLIPSGTNETWWEFIKPTTTSGVGTTALRFPLDLSKDFAVNITTSTGSGTSAGKWSTDFIGMILSTSEPNKLAENTLYQPTGTAYNGTTSGEAGYAKSNVDWQLAFGTDVYGHNDNVIIGSNRTPYNVARQTTKGVPEEFQKNSWQAENVNGNMFFDTNLQFRYDASQRQISMIAVDANYALGLAGTRTVTTTVPAGIDRLSLAIAGAIQSNVQKSTSTVHVRGLSGSYLMADTSVDFKTVAGKTMGAESHVHAPVGLPLSVAGTASYNLDAPTMPGYGVTADATPRTGTVGETSQPLQVLYEGAVQQLPVEIRDRDNGDQLVTTKSVSIKTDAPYSLTAQELAPLVPENYVYESAAQANGILTVDASGKVTSDPVVVYVTHKKEIQTHSYTRTITYVTPDTVTPPDPVVQTVNQRREVDMVTKAETILDKDLSFPAVETPNLTGYVPDVYTVPKETIDTAQENYTVTVTYSGTIGLSVPTSVDFGTVPVESGVFRGQANQPAQVVNGQLAVIDTKSVGDRTWHLEAQVTQAPTDRLTASTLTNVSYLINDQQVSATTPTTIFNGSQMTGTEHELFSSKNTTFLQLRFPKDLNSQNYHIDSPYDSQIKWTLANVPV